MTAWFRSLSVFCSLLAATTVARAAAAQECVGLPSGRGMLSVGFEGTDGATGVGLNFAYQTPGAALVVQHRSLDGFTLVDDLSTSEAQVSARLPATGLPICAVVGGNWTAYDNDRLEGESWDGSDPRYKTERHRLGGLYQRLRVPVGVSLGREFRLGQRLSLVPFVQPAAVLERERYMPEGGAEQLRNELGWALTGGLAASFDWFVLHSTISHTVTHEYALSSQHNFPRLSVHAGVRF